MAYSSLAAIGAAVIGIALPMPQAHHFLRRVLGLALLNGLDGQGR